MKATQLELAVLNNVCWYEALFAAQGLPSLNDGRVWRSDALAPPFHANLVVLAAGVSQQEVQGPLLALGRTARPAGWSMKDSYAALDLSTLGFARLFEASWIWRDASLAPQPLARPALAWREVAGAADLAAWEAAWWGDARQASDTRLARQFPDGLLASPDHAFFAGLREGVVVAGGVANRSAGAVGLSNLFSPQAHAREAWAQLVAGTVARFPNLPVVGYERGADLDLAENAGFVNIGPLCVWRRAE